MIERLHIDGFKSLVDFDIDIHKGLNVLIGPNGAGKTNICQAFGLVAAMARDELVDYLVTTGGGAHGAFSDFGGESRSSTKRIECTCKGTTTSVRDAPENEGVTAVEYAYSFTVEFMDKLRISSEQLVISVSRLGMRNTKEVLRIRRSSREFFPRPCIEVRIMDADLAGSMGYLPDSSALDNKTVQPQLPGFGEISSVLGWVEDNLPHGLNVCMDLLGVKVTNIDPHVARMSVDQVEPPHMLPNGGRLANVVHRLESEDGSVLGDINDFLPQVCPSFAKVQSVSIDRTMQRSFSVIDDQGREWDAARLSDGTVKAIATLIALRENKGGFAILEEPENYLHPWACQSLIEYLREVFKDGACVLTSHSETVLNALAPQELVIVEAVDGKTRCRRVENPEQLEKLIAETGFGCGDHYISGGLGGVPT